MIPRGALFAFALGLAACSGDGDDDAMLPMDGNVIVGMDRDGGPRDGGPPRDAGPRADPGSRRLAA